jgi:hypothetical protein
VSGFRQLVGMEAARRMRSFYFPETVYIEPISLPALENAPTIE